jgi:hypothetical protein
MLGIRKVNSILRRSIIGLKALMAADGTLLK